MSQHPTTTAPIWSAATDSTRVRKLAALAAFAAFTALGARMSVPLPGTPVPFTLQPVAVLLAGLLLGPALGAASQFAYLAAGAAGLPVFAAGGGLAYLGGPTGGYLMAFPVAAGVAGWVAGDPNRCPLPIRTLRVGAAVLAGLAVLHLGGAAWLSLQPWLAGGSADVFRLSFEPFLLGDVLKIGLVAVVALGLGDRIRRRLEAS
ncbi:MAG: biotin transporter BioY [Gemmatimonadota bacterium]